MKKQDITYKDKLNELMLDISHPNSKGIAFILVEGKADIKLFRKIFNLDSCKVESIPGGNMKVEECVTELLTSSKLVIGIRDADFIRLGATCPYPFNNVYITDFHDIEMMIVHEDEAFKALSCEFLGVSDNENEPIRGKILKSLETVGYLKWLNNNENLRFKFDCGFQDLISFETESIDFSKYLKRVLAKSPNAVLSDEPSIYAKVENLKMLTPALPQLINGHDFAKAFAKYINEFGNSKGVSEDTVASALRLAFTFAHFSKTDLFNQIESWSLANNCTIHPAK